MKPLALTLSILFSLPMICLAIRAAALHWRANRKPKMSCPGCGKPATFVRDRGFKDGSGLVFTCDNEKCSKHWLYFYPDHFVFRAPITDRRAEHRTRREIMRKIIERGGVK